MFFKLFTLSILAVATLAAPNSPPSGGGQTCNTGSIQCCDSTTTASNPVAAGILGLLGLVLGANVPVGLTCSPVTVVGTGSGSTCTQDPVCCSDVKQSGLIAIGCTPININL